MKGRDVAAFCEDEKRMPSNARLGTVIFPNGSLAVLPPVENLQAAVARVSLQLHWTALFVGGKTVAA